MKSIADYFRDVLIELSSNLRKHLEELEASVRKHIADSTSPSGQPANATNRSESSIVESYKKKRKLFDFVKLESENFLLNFPEGKLKQYTFKQNFANKLIEFAINEAEVINEEDLSKIINDFKEKVIRSMSVASNSIRTKQQFTKEFDPKAIVDNDDDDGPSTQTYDDKSDDEIEDIVKNQQASTSQKSSADVKNQQASKSQKSSSDVKGTATASDVEELEQREDEEKIALDELNSFSDEDKEAIISNFLNAGILNLDGKVKIPTGDFKGILKRRTDKELEKYLPSLTSDHVAHLMAIMVHIAHEQEEDGYASIFEKIKKLYKKTITEIGKKSGEEAAKPQDSNKTTSKAAKPQEDPKTKPQKAPESSVKPQMKSYSSNSVKPETKPTDDSRDTPSIPRPKLPQSVKTPTDFANWMQKLSRDIYSTNKSIGTMAQETAKTAKDAVSRGAFNAINPEEQFNAFMNLALSELSEEDLYKLITSTSGF